MRDMAGDGQLALCSLEASKFEIVQLIKPWTRQKGPASARNVSSRTSKFSEWSDGPETRACVLKR